VWGDFNLVRY
jgi:hypothetical protein